MKYILYCLLSAAMWWPSGNNPDPRVVKSVAMVSVSDGRCTAFSPLPHVWVTKLHCADDSYSFKILGETAEFVKEDADLDLLLLHGPVVPSIKIAKKELAPGEAVTMFGWPVGWNEAPPYISHGHMSAVGLWPNMPDGVPPSRLNAIDGTCYFGMSGGPAVDKHGEVVGVIDSLSTEPPIPIAYITPLKELRKFLGLT